MMMMMTMGMKKVPVILVVCVLLFSSLDVLEAESSFGPAECCFKYRSARLPKVKVVTFERTNIHCASYAVVFTMKNGAKICADPTQEWVQKLVTHLESTAVTAPFEGSV